MCQNIVADDLIRFLARMDTVGAIQGIGERASICALEGFGDIEELHILFAADLGECKIDPVALIVVGGVDGVWRIVITSIDRIDR